MHNYDMLHVCNVSLAAATIQPCVEWVGGWVGVCMGVKNKTVIN